jgi:hypothetical protein
MACNRDIFTFTLLTINIYIYIKYLYDTRGAIINPEEIRRLEFFSGAVKYSKIPWSLV